MYDFLDKIGLKLVLEAIKGKLESYALKSLYGDREINVGRKAGTTIGYRSTAEGIDATASGLYSHAEGRVTEATGDNSHSEGSTTHASGMYSHAEGCSTEATGDRSHSEGDCTNAVGWGSHAEGGYTTASGQYAHAEGWYTTASGRNSHASGLHTVSWHDNEASYGKYNESKDNTLFSIGDGTGDDARHNAFEITTTGGKLHDKNIAVDIANPNLLINPDFKINQRGATSGSSITQSQGYIVDRWRIIDGDYSVNPDSITLAGTLVQILEYSIGSDFTASVFTSSGTATATYDDSTRKFTIVSSGTAVITGAKLEIGSVATPFATPDPVEELRKCQKYYRIITNTMIQPYMYYTNLLLYFIPIHDMREDDNNDIAPIVTVSGTINEFSGIVIYNYYGGDKVGDIDTISASFQKGWGVMLYTNTLFNPSGLTGTMRIAGGAKITIDAEIY